MNYKEKFNEILNKYYENNLIKEVYSNEDFSIINFGNLFYLICPYIGIKNGLPFGLRINAENIEKFIDSPHLLYGVISNTSKKDLSRLSVDFSPDKFERNSELLKKLMTDEPSEYIDFELEERVSKIGKKIM